MSPAALSGHSRAAWSPMAGGLLRCRALRIGRRHQVVLAPTPGSRPVQLLELLMALRLATSLRAPLWLLAPGEGAALTLRELGAEEPVVKVISGWRAKLLEWLILPRGHRFTTIYGSLIDLAVRRGRRQPSALLESKPKQPNKPAKAATVYIPPSYKRLWLDSAPRLAIPADRRQELQSALDQLGIADGARLVAIHLGGSANGSHGQETLEGYRSAIAWLQRQGFMVVHVGEAEGLPVNWPGVVDLTPRLSDTELLQLHCIARAAFLMTDLPEVSVYGWALGTPVLTVNAVDGVRSFPVRERDMITVRRVRRTVDGRVLPLGELFSDEIADDLSEGKGEYQLVDNTPGEVLAAVQDMVGAIAGRISPETPEQREFRFLATRVGMMQSTQSEAAAGYGPHHCYLGRGRIAPSFAQAGPTS